MQAGLKRRSADKVFNRTGRRRDPDRDRSMHLFEKKDPGDTYPGGGNINWLQ